MAVKEVKEEATKGDETKNDIEVSSVSEAEKTDEANLQPSKSLDTSGYVLIKHMGRSPESRTIRAARSGFRKQGFVLSNGTRIRKSGMNRFTQVSKQTLEENKDQILEGIKAGFLAVFEASHGERYSYEDVCEMLGVKEKVVAPKEDETKKDIEVSAVTAAVDQAEAEKTGEANPRPSEKEEESYTEEDLEAMTRSELNDLAEEMGIENPSKMSKKADVIEALMNNAEED